MGLSFPEFLGWLFAAIVGVYLAVRFGSAAYFKSKQQYESEKSNGRP